MRHIATLWLTCLAACASAAELPTRPVLLTGEVMALDSQPILVPASNSAPVLLRNFLAEGTPVKRGDLVLRIDTQEGNNIRDQEAELEQTKAKARREWTDLAVKALDADQELLLARAAVRKAEIDAALPRNLIPALDHDRYQGELVRTRHDLEVKQQSARNAEEAVQRRRADGELEAKKLLLNVLFLKSVVNGAEVRAERDGVIVHGYSEWRGERADEGSSAFPGNTVGQVMGSGAQMRVRAWALEADRPFLALQQPVRVSFDGLPGTSLTGTIEHIASAPQQRPAWGSGRYFQVDIELPATQGARLVAGMSALVEPQSSAAQQRTAHSAPGTMALQLEGEIASRSAIAISPPQIPEIWQFNLASLAPEGSLVRAGDPIAVFGGGDLPSKLDAKQSLLKEKQRALDKLQLDHTEARRAADIEVAEARSNLDKAQRKVSQPKDQIRRVDYDKLIIDSELNQQLADLAQQRHGARAEARAAERAALDGEIKRLQVEIEQLNRALASLTVKAQQPGLVLYRLQFNGEKFAVGNQVWRGVSVATLADPQQLLVNATVPEAQATLVQLGQSARITVPGANLALTARVTALGRTYHIKSRSQPVIVRDVELVFDTPPRGLKPGAAVQIALLPRSPSAAAHASLASEP